MTGLSGKSEKHLPRNDGRLFSRLAVLFSIVVVGLFLLIILLKVGILSDPVKYLAPNSLEGIDFSPIIKMELNEWGDFFAGVGGTLALVWLITSTLLQRAELSENRKELERQNAELSNQTKALVEVGRAMSAQEEAMKKQVKFLANQAESLPNQIAAFSAQASALSKQAEILQATSRANIEDRAWRDIQDLLQVIRSKVYVNNDFYFWEIENKSKDPQEPQKIKFCYMVNNQDDLEKLSDISFLYRAAGALKTALKPLKNLDEVRVLERRDGRRHFRDMKQLFSHVEIISEDISSHRKLLIQDCRISEWRELLDIAIAACEINRGGSGK